MLCEVGYLNTSRYILGTMGLSRERMEEIAESSEYYSLPVYAYIHSGSTISCAPFGCSFDSGCSGIAFVRKDDPEIQGMDEAAVYEGIRASVEHFAQYLQGEVYGVSVQTDDGTVLDSLGWIYGYEEAEEEGQRMLKEQEERAQEVSADVCRKTIIDHYQTLMEKRLGEPLEKQREFVAGLSA
jgi:hypothetical protein